MRYCVAPGHSFTHDGKVYKPGEQITAEEFGDAKKFGVYIAKGYIIPVEDPPEPGPVVTRDPILPKGGNKGDVLQKLSDTDYDAGWGASGGGGGSSIGFASIANGRLKKADDITYTIKQDLWDSCDVVDIYLDDRDVSFRLIKALGDHLYYAFLASDTVGYGRFMVASRSFSWISAKVFVTYIYTAEMENTTDGSHCAVHFSAHKSISKGIQHIAEWLKNGAFYNAQRVFPCTGQVSGKTAVGIFSEDGQTLSVFWSDGSVGTLDRIYMWQEDH